MSSAQPGLGGFLVVSIILVLGIAILIRTALVSLYDQISAIAHSFGLGILLSVAIVLLIKGLGPFFHGVHISWKSLLIIWLFCSILVVSFVGYNIEISRNVIIDSLIIGGGLALCIAIIIIGSGCYTVSHQEIWGKTLQISVLLGLFLGVITRSILWTLE